MTVSSAHFEILKKSGIFLEKETKRYSVVQLKGYEESLRINASVFDALVKGAKKQRNTLVAMPKKLTLGVELEFVGDESTEGLSEFCVDMVLLTKRKFTFTGKYGHNDGKSWVLGRDGSINTRNTDLKKPFGFELTTPKLNLFSKTHTKRLAAAAELIRGHLKGFVNDSCGTHVHIGFSTETVPRNSMVKLLAYYADMEKRVFDPIVPKGRRRNRYCKSTEALLRNKYQKLSTRYCNFDARGNSNNLRFECRQLEGTLDVKTIMYWSTLQATILVDMLTHIRDNSYLNFLARMNIFDILYHYNFSTGLRNFFIDRAIKFRSRTLLG